ncbi:MAG: NINE protein, partial [Cyanothece sp. SIO2G6]|nr:NINE protein [Cyanothece sp. SIO2G6]
MKRVESGTAYLLWGLWLFGLCGGQRFYTGHIVSGILYLFTFGFFGVGQFLDIFLIPGMVHRRNLYLKGLELHSSATVAIETPIEKQTSPLHTLLGMAAKNGGSLSLAQATLYTE